MNENTFVDSFFFGFNVFWLHLFSLLSHFCLLSHFEIIRSIAKLLITTSTYFLLKHNRKKENVKSVFLCLRLSLRDLFFIIIFTFIIINRIISLKQIQLFFQNMLYLYSFQLKVHSQGVAFMQPLLIFFSNFSLVFLIKLLLF